MCTFTYIGLVVNHTCCVHLRRSNSKVGQSGYRQKGLFKAESFSTSRPNCRIWREIGRFRLVVLIGLAQKGANYVRFSVWCLSTGGAYLPASTVQVLGYLFACWKLYSILRTFIPGPKNLFANNYFRFSPQPAWSGYGPYHGMWHECAQTKCIGTILTP